MTGSERECYKMSHLTHFSRSHNNSEQKYIFPTAAAQNIQQIISEHHQGEHESAHLRIAKRELRIIV